MLTGHVTQSHWNLFFPFTGMDLKPGREGGTWLGITKDGTFGAITNYRQSPTFLNPHAVGKGHLVPDFLEGDGNVRKYLEEVSRTADKYNGFNLLVGKLSLTGSSKFGCFCNADKENIRVLTPGIHALSNNVLDCPWPKMVYGKERFANILNEACIKQELVDKLIGMLNLRDR